MIIQKRLIQITAIVIVFTMLLVFGLFQVAKGARFHQLNLLHLRYVVELREHLLAHGEGASLDDQALKATLVNIKAQPEACLDLINIFDRFVMRLIGTAHAIQLCNSDIVTAEEALDTLALYREGELSLSAMQTALTNSAAIFADNSTKFERPIEKTVDFIVASSFTFFSILSILMISTIVYVIRGVSKSVTAMHETTKALERSERLNRKLAHYDSLTGLPNRNLFLDRISHQLNVAKRNSNNLALLFIDLDRFKNVNDSMGHQAGDELIQQAGSRLSSCVRDSDTVARIGGDEFNIILNQVSSIEDSAMVAEKIIRNLSEPFNINGQSVYISGSIGISAFPNDADNAEDLQKYADLAMYQAKAKGRNKFEFYSCDLDHMVNTRLQMEQYLRCAIEKEEFTLHFQPVVRLEDFRIVGVEALIRWQHPKLGMVPPSEFISLAEETGLIVEIGDWVIKKACHIGKKWFDDSDSNFKVAVNVSPLQLQSESFINSVKESLSSSGLPPSALDIEITENLMIEEEEISLGALQKLSDLGVRLLLDDFGTGHSSLSYLHKLPFNVLKIDRSFILKLGQAQDTENIVSSVVAMAHELGLSVIAEGIETAESLSILKTLKCEYAQGYFLSHPVPASEIDCNRIYSAETT